MLCKILLVYTPCLFYNVVDAYEMVQGRQIQMFTVGKRKWISSTFVFCAYAPKLPFSFRDSQRYSEVCRYNIG